MSKTLYTARELAEILKISPQTVYKLANEGKIEGYTVGKSRRFLMPKKDEEKLNAENGSKSESEEES